MRPTAAFLFAILLCAPAPANAFVLSNFDAPDSVLADPEDGSYYVSNVNGAPSEKDGNGYISKISSNGAIVIQKFIGGKKEDATLHAPKGMAIVGGRLFVSDIDTVKVFDKRTRKAVAIVDLSKQKARFLNDVAADLFGNVYVSDTLADRIYVIRPEKAYAVGVFKESEELGGPNGLLVNPRNRNLMVTSFRTGRLLEFDSSGRLHVLKKGLASLDGLDYDDKGYLYVSSVEKGEIYRIPHFGRGPVTTFASGLISPSDIAFDRRKDEVLVPSSKAGRLTTLPRNRTNTEAEASIPTEL